jgi:competence protein ComEC
VRPGPASAAGVLAAALLFALIGSARPVACLAVAVLVPAGAALGAARLAEIDHSELKPLAGRAVTLRGYVTKRERTSFGVRRVRVRARSLLDAGSTRRVDELTQVRIPRQVRFAQPSIGDEIVASGTVEVPLRRPGQSFDYAAYLRRAGVHTTLRAREVRLTGARRGGVAGVIDALRRRAEAGVSAGLDPSLAALARGMVLGEDEEIPARMSEDFKRSGLAHVLAVSGQNVTLLAVLAWPLLGMLGVGRRLRLGVVLALIGVYVPLTGAGPSIVRAGAMGAAGTVAALGGRPASRWYSLLLALVVTLALDPRAWQDVGWQLSFAAVVGIFLLVRPFTRALVRLPEPLAGGAALTLAATIATAPLMSLHFGRVSLVSLPANVAALPAIAPVMWIGMLASGAAQVSVLPAVLLNALDAYLLGYVATVARWSAALPGAVWEVRITSPAGLIGAYCGLGVVAAGLVLKRRGSGRPLAVGVALAVAVVTASLALRHPPPAAPRDFTATFLDVGQGDATLFQTPDGPSVLVDGGPPEADVVDALRRHGVRSLDVAVLTHAQRDHQGGLEAVLRELPVGLLLDGGMASPDPVHARIVAAARARGTRVIVGAAGQEFEARGLRIRVLSPAADDQPDPDADPNLHALVLLVSYGSLDFFLPADAESDVTSALGLRRVEVLKVAHHGSADEGLGPLLERLAPRAAVIEVGAGNPYGHPSPATVATLRSVVPRVYRTDRDGEVTVGLHGGALEVTTGG